MKMIQNPENVIEINKVYSFAVHTALYKCIYTGIFR